MLLDARDDAVAPGRPDAYLKRHMTEALPVTRAHLGGPFGDFTADPRWLACRAGMGETGWMLRQENRLLRPLILPPP